MVVELKDRLKNFSVAENVLAQNHDMTTQEIIVATLALITKGRT